MISLDDLLKTPSLSGLKAIAGHDGLTRQINTVTLLDAPDGPRWLTGGEFVLTSAYIFDNNDMLLKEYILALIKSEASGLGIKTGRFMNSISDQIIAVADEHRFPIVQIPYNLVWTDIIAPFYKLKYELQDQVRPVIVEPDMILPLFEASRWGARRLLLQLTELFQLPAAVYKQDRSMLVNNGIRGATQIGLAISQLKALPERKHPEEVIIDDFICSFSCLPLSYDGEREYLAIASEREADIAEINKLLVLLESLSGNDITSIRAKSDIYRSFIYKIVTEEITTEEITAFESNRSENKEEKIYTGILILSSDHYPELYQHFKEALDLYWKLRSLKLETYLFDNPAKQQAVVLLEIYSNKMLDCNSWLRGLIPLIDSRIVGGEKSHIAFGSMTDTLRDIVKVYEQAQQSLKLGKLLWPDQICYFYPDYTMYALLNEKDLNQVGFEDFKLLFKNKSTTSFDAVETAEIYIESGNYKRAAAKLFVHENTLRYRINKISELLNINLENPVEGYRFLTKIKLWKLYCSYHGSNPIK